ncbi:STAS domain-containing protein [Dactylosporangium sp. CA-092794]
MSTADQLREALSPAIDERPAALTVDFAGVTFLDSTAINVLVTAPRGTA